MKSLRNLSSDPIAWGLQNLLSGVEKGFEHRQEALSRLAEQKEKMEQLKKLEEYYESEGLSRSLAHQPEFVQKERLKSHFKPKSTIDRVLDRFFPERTNRANQQQQEKFSIIRDEKGKPVTIQVGNEYINADQLDPQTLQRIEAAEAQMNAPEQEETWGHTLGQAATGAGVGALQKAFGFLPDIASLPFLAENLTPNPTDVKSWEYEMAERNPQQQPQNFNPLDVIEAYKQMPSPLNPLKELIPTTSNLLNKHIPALTKGTVLEPYTTAKTETGKRAQELGNVTALLANPTGTLGQKAANILKSAGIALTGEAADVLGEEITGSKAVGKGLKLGTYVAASMFPGGAKSLGEKQYEKFGKEVIDKAAAEGKAIDALPVRDKMKAFSNRVSKDFPHLTEDAKMLHNEIAKAENAIFSYNDKGQLKESIDPTRLWDSIKDLGKKVRDHKYNSISSYLEELNGIQENSLETFADTVIPEGGKILQDANSLWRTSKQIAKDADFLKNKANVKFGPGMLLWMSGGGYKALIGMAGARAAKAYATRMMNNPTIMSLTKKLAAASSRQNIALAKQLSDKLNEKAETIIDKLSPEDQKSIRDAIKKSNSKSPY